MDGKTRKKTLTATDDLEETRRSYNMKEEVLGRGLWKTPFGRAYGFVIRKDTLLLLLLLLLLLQKLVCV